MESSNPRAATVIATLDSELVTLSRDQYQQIVSNLNQYKVQEIVQFFKNLPLFHYLAKDQLEFVAVRCQLRKFVTNTLILRQEDMPRSIYFVKAGRIKILRKVEFKIPETNADAENIKELTRDPLVEEYD